MKAGKAKGLTGFEMNKPGLLHRGIYLLPFIKSTGNNQTSAFLEGISKTWFISDGFRPGIDHFVTDGRIFCPGRYEPPFEFDQAVDVVMNNSGYLLTGIDIVVRSVFASDIPDAEGFDYS
jgi:hypothetical protein